MRVVGPEPRRTVPRLNSFISRTAISAFFSSRKIRSAYWSSTWPASVTSTRFTHPKGTAQFLFQQLDVLAHGGLRDVKMLPGPSESPPRTAA